MDKELSHKDPLQSFIQLITFDQEFSAIQDAITSSQGAIDVLIQDEHLLTTQKNDAYTIFQNAKKSVDTYEFEMQHLDAQEKMKKKQLDVVSNVRQYQSLQAELELIKKEQHTLEETLIGAWNAFETAQKTYNEYEQTYERERAKITEDLKEHKEKRAQLIIQKEALEQERAQKCEGIPSEWLERYDIMRGQIKDPVVPVDEGYCSACHYAISAPDMQRLHKRALIQCKNCFRFLYDPTHRNVLP